MKQEHVLVMREDGVWVVSYLTKPKGKMKEIPLDKTPIKDFLRQQMAVLGSTPGEEVEGIGHHMAQDVYHVCLSQEQYNQLSN
jgi:hypothetical protein